MKKRTIMAVPVSCFATVIAVCLTGILIDDQNPDRLIAVGAAILIAGITADNVNLWLKQVASRPRYKYLITLSDPKSGFRNWWQMIPNLAGSDDNFKSWLSGNMTIASMMFSLPMLADVTKTEVRKRICCALLRHASLLRSMVTIAFT